MPDKIFSPKKLGISSVTAITTTVIGSFISVEGTLVGVAAGPIIGGIAEPVYNKIVDHTWSVLKKRKQPVPLWIVHRARARRQNPVSQRVLLVGAATAVAIGGAAATGFTMATEAATGQTLHGAVTPGTHSYGSSFGSSSTTSPLPIPTYTPTYTPSFTSVPSSLTPSPTISPSDTTVPAISPSLTLVPTPSTSITIPTEVPSGQPSSS